MWHVRKVQDLLIKGSLLCFTESQNLPVSARLTVVGVKRTPPTWGASISQTCICSDIKFYAVSKKKLVTFFQYTRYKVNLLTLRVDDFAWFSPRLGVKIMFKQHVYFMI